MCLLRIVLFGRFDVRFGRQPLVGLDARKVQELFCYLLLNRDRPHPREALADLLWCDSSSDRPNRCLRKTLWQLRVALDSGAELLSERVLLVEPDWIQFCPDADLWLDVAVFEQAFRRVQRLPGNDLNLHDVQILEDAVSLYRGGLRESWYQDWYLYERERFQHMYLIVLDKLMGYCEAHERYAEGIAYGTMILACERARERTYRRLMRLHYLAGDRTAALRQYEHCLGALQEELGVGPAQRTVALHEQIRTDHFPNSTPQLTEPEAARPTVDSVPSQALRSLVRLLVVLTQVEQDIREEIQILQPGKGDQG
jgi:DNA-binding SARP family transcriptional activator